MTIQTINIGTTPNDGTGDPARTAFTKLNANFTQSDNAASKLVATNAQAIAGTAGVLPDAAGVHAAFKQYGLGALRDGSALGKDFNLFTTPGFYQLSSGAPEEFLNAPAGAAPSRGHLLVFGDMAPYGAQVFFGRADNTAYFRNCNGSFKQWLSIFSSGNMQPGLANGLNSPRLMRNVSGATVNSEADTAGAGLRFCDFSTTGVLTASATAGTGTWKNISGTAIAANEYGLFVRIV